MHKTLLKISDFATWVLGNTGSPGPAVSWVFEGIQGQLKGRDLRGGPGGGLGGSGGGFSYGLRRF